MASIMKRGSAYSVRYTYTDHRGKKHEGWESFKTKKRSKRLTKQRTCQTRSPSERIIPCNGRVILRAVSKIHGHSEKIH